MESGASSRRPSGLSQAPGFVKPIRRVRLDIVPETIYENEEIEDTMTESGSRDFKVRKITLFAIFSGSNFSICVLGKIAYFSSQVFDSQL